MKQKPELLAPAGNLEKLRTAVTYGADAVYLTFGRRPGAFAEAELVEGVYHAHAAGVRVYAAVDPLARASGGQKFMEDIHWLDAVGVDAFIVSDPAVFALVRRAAPALEVHIGEEVSAAASARHWRQLGAARVKAARELTVAEIARMYRESGLALAATVHGPCNSRELVTLPYLDRLARAGISAFIIEGRRRSAHWLATVLNAYRVCLDAWWETGRSSADEDWLRELACCSSRPWSTGFYFADSEPCAQSVSRPPCRPAAFVAFVESCSAGWLHLDVRNSFAVGAALEFVVPGRLPLGCTADRVFTAEGAPISGAFAVHGKVKIPWRGEALPPFTVVRRVKT